MIVRLHVETATQRTSNDATGSGSSISKTSILHRSGPDADFITVSSPRVFSGPSAERDARHRKAMNDFEDTLRGLKHESGGY